MPKISAKSVLRTKLLEFVKSNSFSALEKEKAVDSNKKVNEDKK